jgi:hypothetical protein
VFINAWNEWSEGYHLEPCQKWGGAYLEATRQALLQSIPNLCEFGSERDRMLTYTQPASEEIGFLLPIQCDASFQRQAQSLCFASLLISRRCDQRRCSSASIPHIGSICLAYQWARIRSLAEP